VHFDKITIIVLIIIVYTGTIAKATTCAHFFLVGKGGRGRGRGGEGGHLYL
jgi:hypothetical protein